MELLEKYKKLNDSFSSRRVVFHVGAHAGFFSEYNNMILTMLYCLHNKIRFTLFSKDANFGYDKGWTDYFQAFTEEEENMFHSRYNFRYPGITKTLRPQVLLYRLFHPNTFLTFEILNKARHKKWENEHYDIPGLGIDGDLQDACRVLVDMTWRYNDQTKARVQDLISSLHLPESYIGFHVRAGDKRIETSLLDVSKYISSIPEDYPLKNAFVLTDDYLIVEKFRKLLNGWNIYTLCGEEERGYFHEEFQKKRDSEFIRKSHELLFASMDILSKSNLFIGTFSSNPGMYLGMVMPPEKTFSVDVPHWTIW
ncbi:hypothetical protein FACS1894174_04290 [Bacteroidia bacterium]|nr:hypothetical protein FACS1894174_04290 [Bacteroidia bacterium]